MFETGLFELNAVAAISAHRSFRAAATELGISPSALSHTIAGLEKRLGVRIIDRTTRSVALSEAGERFLARVSPAPCPSVPSPCISSTPSSGATVPAGWRPT